MNSPLNNPWNNSCRISNVARNYLAEFQCILENMIRGMTEAGLTDSISYNFIVQMIPHHQAAIEMSENILQYTTDLQVQNIATEIITEQTKSIEHMRKVQYLCGELGNSRQDVCRYQRKMDQIMQTMFSAMRRARATNRVNCDFMWEMIPHHRGAVEMSETTLQYHICPKLVPILEAIISSQKKGIMQMQQLLRCRGC